jgi:hypothetical protein
MADNTKQKGQKPADGKAKKPAGKDKAAAAAPAAERSFTRPKDYKPRMKSH